MGSIESFGESLEGNEVGGRKVKKEGKMELAKKGGKVRFRIGGVEGKGVGIGLNLRNGVCRGGKRVCWNYNREKNDVMVGEIEDQSSTLKRKR
ncbi:Polyamine oxidase-like protein [Quillaja saponaria]|uniref:Polyamine oxidase-like protein n=1 Tax=Quillaja saponaria TaxID=32244 RepID=A0AAD7M3N9_QUISA|nr:Polyamine oxidase-like protein [Quillaja saponaria]